MLIQNSLPETENNFHIKILHFTRAIVITKLKDIPQNYSVARHLKIEDKHRTSVWAVIWSRGICALQKEASYRRDCGRGNMQSETLFTQPLGSAVE